jgi:NACalpha-BTF3-like transcription factor
MSFSLIKRELGLEEVDDSKASDQEMINAISERVGELLDQDVGLLMSYLYRLDVSEEKAKAALQQRDQSVSQAIAELIWQRQKQRMKTKKDIEVRKDEDFEGLEW